MIEFTAPKERVAGFKKQLSDNLSDKEHRVLELLIEYPGYTSSQLSEKMNVSRVSITKYLKALKEIGAIERVGSDRSGYWKVK